MFSLFVCKNELCLLHWPASATQCHLFAYFNLKGKGNLPLNYQPQQRQFLSHMQFTNTPCDTSYIMHLQPYQLSVCYLVKANVYIIGGDKQALDVVVTRQFCHVRWMVLCKWFTL